MQSLYELFKPRPGLLQVYRGNVMLTELPFNDSPAYCAMLMERDTFGSQKLLEGLANFIICRGGYDRPSKTVKPEFTGLRLVVKRDGWYSRNEDVPPGLAATIENLLNEECDVRDGAAVVCRVPRHAVDAELARLHREQPDKNHVVSVNSYFYKFHRETKDVIACV
jgi:hypothetical protein